jgi:hypothetical protein
MHTLHRQYRPAGLQNAPALHTISGPQRIKPYKTRLAAQRNGEQASIRQQLGLAAANAVLATSLLFAAPQPALANEVKVGADPVVSFRGETGQHEQRCTRRVCTFSHACLAILQYDGAGVLMADARDNLSQQLLDLEQ